MARSARIGGTLIRSPMPPSGVADRARRATGRTGSPACSRGRSRARRSRSRPFVGEVVRPEAERRRGRPRTRTREQVCENEAEGEAEREDDQDRADGSLRPGRPRRRSRASLVPTGYGASHRETAPARAWKVDRSVAQGRPGDPAADRPSRDRPRWTVGWRSPSASCSVVARLRRSTGDPGRPLLRPLRVAGVGVPRGPGGHPLPGRPARPTRVGNWFFQDVLPVASSDGVAARPAAVPAAARAHPAAVRGRVGPGHRRPGDVHGPRRPSTSAICWWMLGRLRDPPPVARWRRRSSSPSGRCSGTRPSSRRPGTRPTSSRSG